jgi:hypothetical protein
MYQANAYTILLNASSFVNVGTILFPGCDMLFLPRFLLSIVSPLFIDGSIFFASNSINKLEFVYSEERRIAERERPGAASQTVLASPTGERYQS